MAAFFKMVLYGLLYAIALPFFLIALAIYGVYCAVMFVYEAIRSLFVFFSGGTPFGDLKEDVKAKKILLARQNAPVQPNTPQPQNVYIFQQQPRQDSDPQRHPLDFGEINFSDFTPIEKKDNEEGGNK